MQRFRALLLALGLLALAAGAGAGLLANGARTELDQDLRLSAASRVTALDDYAERARAVTLVASHSAAFGQFYRADGTREQRIRGEVDPQLMPAVHTALADIWLLFRDSIADAGFVDRSGAENAVMVRGRALHPEHLQADRTDAPFFGPALELPYGIVYQSAPYRSTATDEWVVANAAKVDIGPGVSPAVVYFGVTIESFRLAFYSEDPDYRVRVVDRLDGRVIIDSTKPQDLRAPLGAPEDRSLRWVQTAQDASIHSADGMRHVVQYARTDSNIATSWAVVVSIEELSGPWSSSTALGPVSLLGAGVALLGLSVLGYVRHGRFMHRSARRDDLTGLRNRMSAAEVGESLLARHRRVAVLLMDLDRFKHVNDSLGHRAGDELLTVIGQRLAEVVRDAGDVVARLGGDEFVVLAQGVDDEDAVRTLCERITRAVVSPIRVDGLDVTVGTSIGVALAPEHGTDYGVLLQCADIAMYDAKARRSGWQVYRDGLAMNDRSDLTLDAELRLAASGEGGGAGTLAIHLQPSYSTLTREVTRAEALVRWHHPERGLLLPGDFVPLAETTGAIRGVTRRVLDLALDQAAAWRAQGDDIAVAVNISAHDVNDLGFADEVSAALRRRELPGSSLVVELTETSLLADPDTAAHVLDRLVSAGVRVAVDDFGAGYASLLYLRRFPVAVLKLDRSLVQGLTTNVTDAALVRWTVEMAHSLGMVCVAEGVENVETLAALVDLGCDEAQGYLLQRPVPADDLALGRVAEHV